MPVARCLLMAQRAGNLETRSEASYAGGCRRGSSPACPRSRNLDAHCNFMEKNWCAQLMSGILCPMWQHPDHGCGAHAEACTASCFPGRAFVCGEHAGAAARRMYCTPAHSTFQLSFVLLAGSQRA
ncbi:hypothetical protein EON66_05140 [archaeon]|nr:MAG: hypothetical protein EON66_05140 [archaeon]